MGYKLVIDGVPVSEYDIFGEACTTMLLEKLITETSMNLKQKQDRYVSW